MTSGVHLDAGDDFIPLKPHYVYVLMDPRGKNDDAVFYVGKGSGERAKAHAREASRDAYETNESAKVSRIKDIAAAGLKVLDRVVARVETAAEAHAIEAALIDWVYGRDQLTNQVSGHGHEHIRRKGDHSERTRLDVPARRIGDRNGEYSAKLGRKNESFGTVDRLRAWRNELRELGLTVSELDTSNKMAYKIVVTMKGPVSLRLIARPSAKKTVKLLFIPSSFALREDFLRVATKAVGRGVLRDDRVNDVKAKEPYFYLRDFVDVTDFDTDAVRKAMADVDEHLVAL